MPDDPVLARYCGACCNHRPDTQTCALSLSYAAFVMVDTPANGCEGYSELATRESQAQSGCRPVGVMGLWQAANGAKP